MKLWLPQVENHLISANFGQVGQDGQNGSGAQKQVNISQLFISKQTGIMIIFKEFKSLTTKCRTKTSQLIIPMFNFVVHLSNSLQPVS